MLCYLVGGAKRAEVGFTLGFPGHARSGGGFGGCRVPMRLAGENLGGKRGAMQPLFENLLHLQLLTENVALQHM